MVQIFSTAVKQVLEYGPSPCALSAITNATLKACDQLDGGEDGVVSRVDLSVLEAKVADLVGTKYDWAASSTAPAQKGKVTKKDLRLAYLCFNPNSVL